MRRLLAALGQGWRLFRQPAGSPVPYFLNCTCGQAIQGLRTRRSQAVNCPGCGALLFVAPRSCLPAPLDEEPVAAPAPTRSPWLLPLTAAGVTLVLVGIGLAIFFSRLEDRSTENQDNGMEPTVEEVLASARRLLRDGSFREASRLLGNARRRDGRHPELTQLDRQAAMLADLSQLSLQDIIQKGQVAPQDEWPARFRDFKGRTLLFDDVIRREQDGRHVFVNYQVIVAEEKAEVKLDLDLLRKLPLGQHRLLFGARLANVSREAGVWVVEFERDSGVMLTDEGAAAALGLGPITEELRDLLQTQAKWARSIP